MKKILALLVILVLTSIFGYAFAEICDMDGLTFDVPAMFTVSNEEDMTGYMNYSTQSFITYDSAELEGLSLDDIIDMYLSDSESQIINIDKECEVNGIPYTLVDLKSNEESGTQGKMAFFSDESKCYLIFYATVGTLTDYDLQNFENILNSVKIGVSPMPTEDIKRPIPRSASPNKQQVTANDYDVQDSTLIINYKVDDITFNVPNGFEETQNDSEALIFSNEDGAIIRLTISDTEGLTSDTAAQMMAYELQVGDVQYDTNAEIRGVPYVDFTISDVSGPYYGKAAMLIDINTNTAYKFLYVRQAKLSDMDYDNWNILLNSIQAPTILMQALKANTTAEPVPAKDAYIDDETTEVYEALQKGDRGDAVKRLQEALITLGYLDDTADGNFGPKTEKAVEAYQKAKGLQVTRVADHPTLSSIYAEETTLNKNIHEKADVIISNAKPVQTVEPTPTLIVALTEEPTPEPTAEPTEEPTPEPTAEPTEEPTPEPTVEPTKEPTPEPTAEPTEESAVGLDTRATVSAPVSNNPQTIVKEIQGSEVGSVFYESNDCKMTLYSIDQKGCKILVENNSLNNYGFCVHSLALNGLMTDCNPYMSGVDIPSGKKGYINIDFYDRLITYAPEPPYNNISLLLWAYDNDESYKEFETEVITLIIDPNVNENTYDIGTQLIEDSGLTFSVAAFSDDFILVSVVNNNDYYIDYDISNTTVNGWAMDPGLDVYNVSLFPGCQSLFLVSFKPVKQDANISEVEEFEFSLKVRKNGSYHDEEETAKIVFTR